MESTSWITIDVISKIQKQLDSYDCRSLVFLLYDNPVIALQRITKNDDALKQWAVESSQDHNWQEKIVESLAICKLYGVIKKLGFNVTQVKARYSPQVIDTSVYVDPVRKLFYLTSEQTRTEELNTIKTNLRLNIIDGEDIKDLETVILKVMCEGKYMDKLLSALSKIPLLTPLVFQLRERISDNLLCKLSVNEDASTSDIEIQSSNIYYECSDSDRIMNKNNLDYYPIKNVKRLGLAYIINQQYFSDHHQFPDRVGTDIDKKELKCTLEKLKFTVLVSKNLTSKEILANITNVVNTRFESTDSIFLLCILSHGIKGHILGTDCIAVNITDIQKVIDTEGKEKFNNIPKVIFLQACQGIGKFVPDTPLPIDYLVHWATSPKYDAYRSKKKGSIFIKVLCHMLAEHGQKEHLVDICTKVNDYVNKICTKENKVQLPIIKYTLRKKIYLSPPI